MHEAESWPMVIMGPLCLHAGTRGGLPAACRRHVAALHHAPIDTLEHIGGGGVRCTLAELF